MAILPRLTCTLTANPVTTIPYTYTSHRNLIKLQENEGKSGALGSKELFQVEEMTLHWLFQMQDTCAKPNRSQRKWKCKQTQENQHQMKCAKSTAIEETLIK